MDPAPGTLDTLNEIAAAINDDANAFTTLTSSIAAVQADVDQNETDGDAADAALSARIATLEADPTTATALAAVQADVDQNESDADAASLPMKYTLTTSQPSPDLLRTRPIWYLPVALDLCCNLKTLLQELETAVETKVTTGANVNTLVGSTTDQGNPRTSCSLWLTSLMVYQSDG